jgi:alkanesulfonate monooxygenase SsuD/methylene tetrahydromethanopterin reductase-like flavin-dependent oxidoreductase (luciferase family)
MKFGIFDHLDDSGQPLNVLYEQRLKLIEGYERAGLYAYHLAEHHATPLGMAPSPSVFLAAAAQRTSTIRLGALVFTLALYHPLRLAEEICMLDHLSNGRLEFGIGRGISPIEIDMYGVDNATAQARYMEASEVILLALTSTMLDHEGTHFKFKNVPLPMSPLQKPHPRLWYGVPNPQSVEWGAHNAINVVTLLPPALVRGITDRYREIWAADGRDPKAIPHMGFTRHVVVADTDAKALDIAVRAYQRWHKSFWYLWLSHNRLGLQPPHAVFPEDFNALLERGTAIVGSPDTVREKLLSQVSVSGVNYALIDVSFGDMAPADSARTVDLFARHVMPAFA